MFKQGQDLSLRDKRLFEISKFEITRVNCIICIVVHTNQWIPCHVHIGTSPEAASNLGHASISLSVSIFRICTVNTTYIPRSWHWAGHKRLSRNKQTKKKTKKKKKKQQKNKTKKTCMKQKFKYSWLSLSRPRLSRMTAYLEVEIWSLPKHENLIKGKKKNTVEKRKNCS